MPIQIEGEIWLDIEEIVARFARLSISRAPRPPLCPIDTAQHHRLRISV